MGSNPHGTDVLMKRNTLTQILTEDRVKTQGKDGLVTRIMHLQTEQLETRRGKEGVRHWMFVSSPDSYIESYSQMFGCLEVRSLVMRVEARWMGLVPLFIKETPEISPSPSTPWGQNRKMATKKKVFIRCQIYPHLDLGLPSFQTVRKKFL